VAIDSLSPLLRYHAPSAVCAFLSSLLRRTRTRCTPSCSSSSPSSLPSHHTYSSVLVGVHADEHTQQRCERDGENVLASLQYVAQLHISVSKSVIAFADERQSEVADGVLKVLQKRSKSGKVIRFGEEFKQVPVSAPHSLTTASGRTAKTAQADEFHLKILRRKRAPKATSTASQAMREKAKQSTSTASAAGLSSGDSASSGGAAPLPSAAAPNLSASALGELTFNLQLTESERVARARVSLPHQFHLRGQTSAVQGV
jgi:Elongator subunit Iki1